MGRYQRLQISLVSVVFLCVYTNLMNPKSQILIVMSELESPGVTGLPTLTRMFWGLMSRCRNPRLWILKTPFAICRKMFLGLHAADAYLQVGEGELVPVLPEVARKVGVHVLEDW